MVVLALLAPESFESLIFLEEIAFRKGYITEAQLKVLAEPLKKNQYGQYLLRLLDKTKQTF